MIVLFLAALTLSASVAGAAPQASPEGSSAGPMYWVYLNEAPGAAEDRAAVALSARAQERLERRTSRRSGDDLRDFPVRAASLAPLTERRIEVRRVSRWLRAASARLTEDQVESLSLDPRVRAVRRAAHYVRPLPEPKGPGLPAPTSMGAASRRSDPASTDPRDLEPRDYAASWHQLEMIGATDLHACGFSGQGMLVAMLDTGFLKSHDCLEPLALVAERDFLCDDGDVQYDPGHPCDEGAGDRHGTLTWSALAGFDPGALIGPAYRAEFALARTESVGREIHLEEDNYIAALEWADSLGADLISTSLGYRAFDNGDVYGIDELDGATLPISIAADLAVERGMVLLTAMGNEGPEDRTLIAPADARNVISVGACDYAGEVVLFSSRGPTGDGRTKPELVAHGYGTVSADSRDFDLYTRAAGTSLATPVLAGLATQILEARPDWTPEQVKRALQESADRAKGPNAISGWGVPSGAAALGLFDPAIVDCVWREDPPGDGIPSSGETGTLRFTVNNRGSGPWPGGVLAIVEASEGMTAQVRERDVPPMNPGEWVNAEFLDVAIGEIAEESKLLEVVVRFAPDAEGSGEQAAPRERSVRILVGKRCSLRSFTAVPGRDGDVDIAWDVDVPDGVLFTGIRIFREGPSGERTPLMDGLAAPEAQGTWLDAPADPAEYRYVLLLDLYGGLFTQTLGPATAVIHAPATAEVRPPRPNPIGAGSLRIPLLWPEPGRPVVEIVDVLGRRVRTLEGPDLPAGYPSLTWDLKDASGRAVASGLYVVRIEGTDATGARVFVVR